jgi:adenylate cyclase
VDAAPLGRRLVAIMAVDVAGYSRLMERDEAGTLERLRLVRRELATPLVQRHGGRVVKLMGDGALCEFPSVVDAVACAIELQRRMAEREQEAPDDRRIRFRIGINLGDVIIDGDDIYGDGVNVTARLEALAEPGGILASDAVRQHVEGKLDARFEDLGQRRVKNLERPVRVFRVLPGRTGGPAEGGWSWSRRSRLGAAALLVLTAALAASLGLWRGKMPAPGIEAASIDRMALPLPREPSIVALPFATAPDDGEGRRLAAGLVVALSNELRAARGLFVIAPEAALGVDEIGLTPKGAAERLGVRFVLRGSLGPADDREAEVLLVDAVAGAILWRRGHALAGDAGAVVPRLAEEVRRTIAPDGTSPTPPSPCSMGQAPPSPEAFRTYLEALAAMGRYTLEDSRAAERLLAQIARAEPGFVAVQAWRARNAVVPVLMGWTEASQEALDRADTAAAAAVALAPGCELGSWSAGVVRMITGDHRAALARLRDALALGPTSPDLLAALAKVLAYLEQHDESLERGRAALRSNPIPPDWYHWHLGIAAYLAGHPEVAIESLARAESYNLEALVYYAASHAEAERDDDARLWAREVLRRDPRFSIDGYSAGLTTRSEASRRRLAAALKAAGLPTNLSFECLVRNVCP